MTEERIARLNELARKSKTIQSLEAQLDNVYFLEKDGTKTKLQKKDEEKKPLS